MLRLGLDIGGTKTHGLLLDADGATLGEAVAPTRPGPDGVVATALAVADACADRAGAAPARVGVGIPGVVDAASGVVRLAVNLGISELDLGPRLARTLGVPVAVDNDVKAAALGALHCLGGGELTYVNFGTGVSAASVVGGRVIRGHQDAAGEIGHLSIDPHGEPCGCGQLGCIEASAGGRLLAQRLARLSPPVSLGELMDAAASGHAGAEAELDRIAAGVSGAVRALVLTLGARRVVVAGGVIKTARGLVDVVRGRLAVDAVGSPFLASLDLPGRIVTLPDGYPAGAVGAALVRPG